MDLMEHLPEIKAELAHLRKTGEYESYLHREETPEERALIAMLPHLN